MPVFMPKPPPTSPTSTRTWPGATPGIAAAMPVATAVGIWLLRRTSILPVATSTLATTLRGSIGAGARRWLKRSRTMRCVARANAASVAAASPWRISAAMLSSASGVTTAAPGRVAASAVVTAGCSS